MKSCRIIIGAFAIATTGSLSAAPADPVFKPLIDVRLRYEDVDQANLASNADAITLRVRAGGDLRVLPDTRIIVEAEGTAGILNNYNSTTNRKTLFPTVADPKNIELNRFQIQNRSLPGTVLTLGRQRINLDDQRFVGSVNWRQNEQTFDAARVETAPFKGVLKPLKVDLTYARSDRTVFGIDSAIQHIDGDNIFANIAYATPYGTLTGFGYGIDQGNTIRRQFSSKTFGGRFAGRYAFDKTIALIYAFSFARQSNAYANPNRYTASYYLADVGAAAGGFSADAAYEVLGASSGVAFTSFQTPLATLHKFQGWAEIFLTKPGNGVRDAYGSLGYTVKKAGPFSLNAQAIYHDFRSDRLDLHYGHEIDGQLIARHGKYAFSLAYADYHANAFAANTRRFWAAVDYIY